MSVSGLRLGVLGLSGRLFGQQRGRRGRLRPGSGRSLCLGLLQLLTHLHDTVVAGGLCCASSLLGCASLSRVAACMRACTYKLVRTEQPSSSIMGIAVWLDKESMVCTLATGSSIAGLAASTAPSTAGASAAQACSSAASATRCSSASCSRRKHQSKQDTNGLAVLVSICKRQHSDSAVLLLNGLKVQP